MNFKQKFQNPYIFNLDNASIFSLWRHAHYYTSYLLLLSSSSFIHSFLSQVFVTHRDFTIFSPTFM